MANFIAVTTTGVNMHVAASKDSPNVAVLPKDAQVSVLGNTGMYLQVQHNGQIGFVYMELVQPQAASDASTAWTTTVISPELNLRAMPARTASILATLSQNQLAPVVGYAGTWLCVQNNGQIGYISADCTASVSTSGGAVGPEQVAAFVASAAPGGVVPPGVPAEPLPQQVAIKAQLTPEEIHDVRASIEREPNEHVRGDRYEDLQGRVIYASQRDNQAHLPNGAKIETTDGEMCNLTSLSMALSYLGIPNPKPGMQYEDALEMVRQEHGLPERIKPAGWGGVARKLGAKEKILAEAVTQGRDWWEANVRPHLRQGAGAIMSIGGHIVRLQAVTDEGLIVDDPYGFCRLKPGEFRCWDYLRYNVYDKPGQTVGADSLWPWADVSRHTMRWIAAIYPAPLVLGDEDDEPFLDVEDDPTVVENNPV